MADEDGRKQIKSLGGFELLSLLGRGGMGAVYKARQTSLDRVVALKVLPPSLARNRDFIQRFLREARAAGKLNHANIVTGIDVGEADGFFYFAMEFVEGESLGARLKREGPLPPAEAISIVRQVAEGLRHAHEHGLIHRDVKPDNVLIDKGGTAKLCDLGLARSAAAEDSSLTQTGTALGTPNYISPEQARGEGDIDAHTDIYSLGATLYHLVAGRPPFSGNTAAVVMTHHINDPAPPLTEAAPEAGPGLAAVVAKCMEKSRADRYESMEALAADLDRVARGQAPEALAARRRRAAGPGGTRTTVPVAPITGRHGAVRRRTETAPGGRRAGLLIAAGAGLMLAVALGVWALTRGGDVPTSEPPPPVKPVDPPLVIPKKPPDAGPDLEKMLDAAETFWKAHPGEYDAAIREFEKVGAAAKGTPYALDASGRIEEISARRDAEVKKAGDRLEAGAKGLAGKGDYDGAIGAWGKLPQNLAGRLRPRANAAVRALRKEAEGKLTTIIDKANGLLTAGKPDQGLKALEASKDVKYGAWAPKIAGLRSSLEKAQTNAAELARQQALAAARKALGKYLDDFDAAAVKGDFPGAVRLAGRAKADPALAVIAGDVGALTAVSGALSRAAAAQKAALEELKDGKRRTFITRSGKVRGVVVKVTPKEIVISVAGRLNGQPISYEKRIRIADLAGKDRLKLVGNFAPKAPAEHLAGAIRAFADGDMAAVAAGLVRAKGHPLTPRWQSRLDELRMGKAEAAAKRAWAALAARPEAQPAAKLTEKTAKGLLTQVGAYETQHGATKFAASIAGRLAELKRRAGAAGSKWVRVPAEAIQVLLKGGAQSSADKDTGILTVTVPPKGKAMVPVAVNTRDFRMRFEYRGPGIEMFLRKVKWRGCVLALLSDKTTKVRYYPAEEDGKGAQDVTTLRRGHAAGSWHRLEAVMGGGRFSLRVDGKVVAGSENLSALVRGDVYLLIWDTRGKGLQFRNLALAISEKDTATAPSGGIVTGILDRMDKRAGWFELQADADRKVERYVPFEVGGRPNPKTVETVDKNLFSCNRATVIWKSHKGQRRVTAAWMQIPKETSGTATGTVKEVFTTARGPWATFDLQPDGGGPVECYAPRWQRGGPEKAISAAIRGLKAGQRVRVKWIYEHRKRAVNIERIK